MARQIVHRLLISIPALVGVLFLCFCLLQVVPADPAMVIAGPDAKPETIAAIRQELGLDRSIPIQFFEYIMRLMRGDLGRSIISNVDFSNLAGREVVNGTTGAITVHMLQHHCKSSRLDYRPNLHLPNVPRKSRPTCEFSAFHSSTSM